jgi:hypothetical protein
MKLLRFTRNNNLYRRVRVLIKRISLAKLFTFNFTLLTFLLSSYSLSAAEQITGPDVKLHGGDIYVTTSLSLDENHLQELSNGITKELKFYIDLFRVWKMWPDEFVLGKFFIRTMKSDPVKMEYIATSSDGTTLIRKRFKSLESMVKWALSIDDLKLANTRELEPGEYFVRITAESKIRKLPPVIGYFMIFLPENEFKIKKDSPFFNVGATR